MSRRKKGYKTVSRSLLQRYSEIGLTTAEAMLVLQILDYSWKGSTPFPKKETLAARMGVHAKTITKHLQSLRHQGLLKTRSRRGRSLEYDLSPLVSLLETTAKPSRQTTAKPSSQTTVKPSSQTAAKPSSQTTVNLGTPLKLCSEVNLSEVKSNKDRATSPKKSRTSPAHDFKGLLTTISYLMKKRGISWRITENKLEQLQKFVASQRGTYHQVELVLTWFARSEHQNAKWLRGGRSGNTKPYPLQTLLRASNFPGYLEAAEEEIVSAIADRRTFSAVELSERKRQLEAMEANNECA